jgi:hypothetical protein
MDDTAGAHLCYAPRVSVPRSNRWKSFEFVLLLVASVVRVSNEWGRGASAAGGKG